jgi:hypothetical protein
MAETHGPNEAEECSRIPHTAQHEAKGAGRQAHAAVLRVQGILA